MSGIPDPTRPAHEGRRARTDGCRPPPRAPRARSWCSARAPYPARGPGDRSAERTRAWSAGPIDRCARSRSSPPPPSSPSSRCGVARSAASRARPACSSSACWPATASGCTRCRASMTRSRASRRRSETGRTRSSACSRTSRRRPSSGCSCRASSRSCWAAPSRATARSRSWLLFVVVWFAAVAGDTTGFVLGRKLGRGFLFQHGPRFHITPKIVARVEGIFDRHGGKAIILGRFIGVARAVTPFLAGSSHISLAAVPGVRHRRRRCLGGGIPGGGLSGRRERLPRRRALARDRPRHRHAPPPSAASRSASGSSTAAPARRAPALRAALGARRADPGERRGDAREAAVTAHPAQGAARLSRRCRCQMEAIPPNQACSRRCERWMTAAAPLADPRGRRPGGQRPAPAGGPHARRVHRRRDADRPVAVVAAAASSRPTCCCSTGTCPAAAARRSSRRSRS